MNVLVACEESQRVCKAFLELGHNAFSCDLQEPSGGLPDRHILHDARLVARSNSFFTMDGKRHNITRWHLMIAHPPCTYLTSCGSSLLFNSDGSVKDWERLRKGYEAKYFFYNLWNAPVLRICLENPAPIKHFNLPPYSQIIEPYQFGEPWKKRTCLWLKNLPWLVPSEIVKPLSCWVECTGPGCRTKLHGEKGAVTAKDRSKTFQGVADAMAAQWGNDFVSYGQLSIEV